ncbi:MAG: universal stress protein [Myxococcales bacterium]|nr:universal stress protein [Myxococcales bacterium]
MSLTTPEGEFLVPYDFSVHSDAALVVAADLARRLSAGVRLLHVIQPPAYSYAYPHGEPPPPAFDFEAVSGEVRAALRKTIDGFSSELSIFFGTQVVQGSNVAHAICSAAEELDADLIVMGTHGRTGLAHVFLGSVAERTLRSAPCPVLTFRAPDDHASRAA